MNDVFAKPLVETEKGGSGGGGGATLTPLGRRILHRYREMEKEAGKAVASAVADIRRHLRKK
jgi:molybdate transport system regulatory protein